MEGRYHFHSPEWDDISESAKNLVSSIFRNLKFEELTIIYKHVSLSPCVNKHALYWDKMFSVLVFLLLLKQKISGTIKGCFVS